MARMSRRKKMVMRSPNLTRALAELMDAEILINRTA
jgi:hypothetical protein